MTDKHPHGVSHAVFMENLNETNELAHNEIPENGKEARIVRNIIDSKAMLDFNPALNTSSYVQVQFEEEEFEVMNHGQRINLADQTIYPHAFKIHDESVNMIANMWHCPEDDDVKKYGVHAGAGTVGSTEACLLAGLALKFRWRSWYAKKHGLTHDQVLAVKPNLVISTCYQAAWEKLFRYFDIEPRLAPTSVRNFAIDPATLHEYVDEKTIGVVGIMGNHWAGQFDKIHEINDVIDKLNHEKGYQVGIHVDAASGGFIAPFIKDCPTWDFRLPNVLSISASGHKYGEACAGTGWVVWRHRKDLSEHVAVDVSYLGGHADSYTLNFSRPATGVFSQYYKLLRFGKAGYQAACDNALANSKALRQALMAMTYKGKPRFELLDSDQNPALPVVAMRLNPELKLHYNDIDLQNALSMSHWYVSGYKMSTCHPTLGYEIPLFTDEDAECTMFRVVIKAHITTPLVKDLIGAFEEALDFLDQHDNQYDSKKLRHRKHRTITNHC